MVENPLIIAIYAAISVTCHYVVRVYIILLWRPMNYSYALARVHGLHLLVDKQTGDVFSGEP